MSKKKVEIIRFQPDIKQGLTSEQVETRKKQKLTNKTKMVVGKSIAEIIFTNVFSLFNIVYFIMAGLIIYAGSWTSLLFLTVLIPNIIIGLVEDLHARHLMKKTRVLTAPSATVLRDGQEMTIKAEDVVLDDIVIFKNSSQIIADGIVLEGSIIVNESLLTGESNDVVKNVGDVVYSGSFVTSGKAKVLVDKVGEESYVEKLQGQAAKFRRPKSEILTSLNNIFRYLAIIVISIAIATVITYIVQGKFVDEESTRKAIGSIAGSVVSMIPAGLFLLTSSALAIGVIRLYKKKTAVQELYSIETLARADVLCVDKTGTITDGTMRVKAIIEYQGYSETKIKQIIANMLSATQDDNLTAKALREMCDYAPTQRASAFLPFSSEHKYSAVTFSTQGTFVLGAIEFINLKNKTGVLNRAEEYLKKGYRVLALAHSTKSIKGDSFKEECEIIGLVVLEDNIKADAIETFKWFKENGVQIKVISGDNAITVSEIAKSVGILNADLYVSLDGKSDDEVRELAEHYNVFGRVTPEQKAILIETLKSKGHTVAMTGDGVNDILALKKADCSIAMASGSEATRNISHLVMLESNFSRLPDVVSEGRRVINNIQRMASLFLIKTFFAVVLSLTFLIASWLDKTITYPFLTNHMYMWEFLGLGIPSFLLSIQKNNEKIQGRFIVNVLKKALPAGIIQVAFVLVFFGLYLLRLNGYGYFGLSLISNDATGHVEAYEQVIAMSVVCYSLFSLVALYQVCKPVDKYRGIIIAGASTVMVGFLTMEVLLSIFQKGDKIFLRLAFNKLFDENWLIVGLAFIGATTIYLFVNYLVWLFKNKKEL